MFKFKKKKELIFIICKLDFIVVNGNCRNVNTTEPATNRWVARNINPCYQWHEEEVSWWKSVFDMKKGRHSKLETRDQRMLLSLSVNNPKLTTRQVVDERNVTTDVPVHAKRTLRS